jgi:tRNA U38,U39,U40 pseudouridine synthase TruA
MSYRMQSCHTLATYHGMPGRAVHYVLQQCVITFSSRTDSGVHALANSASVDIELRSSKHGSMEPLSAHVILQGMNFQLRSAGQNCRITHVRPMDSLPDVLIQIYAR